MMIGEGAGGEGVRAADREVTRRRLKLARR